MMTNVFYQTHLCTIGGVETFLYELARLSYENHRDLTIVYKTGDPNQIKRIDKYCKIVALKDIEKPIKCKRAFFNYGTDAIDSFEAEEYIQIIHADFKDKSLKNYKPIRSDKINRYFAVSENNAKSFRELTGKEVEIAYNPINLDKEPKVMTLVSAQRFSPEKGGDRITTLIQSLDNANIPYVWHIFSDTKLSIDSPNVMYHEPTLEIRKWLQYADYVVLLSDTEGFSYTAYESLCIGTPLIITKLPILNELGADATNSIQVEFDMSNVDVYDIYKRAGTFKFKYKPKSTIWLDLIQGEGHYVMPKYVCIRANMRYFDTVEDKHLNRGTKYKTTSDRAELLVNSGLASYEPEEVWQE